MAYITRAMRDRARAEAMETPGLARQRVARRQAAEMAIEDRKRAYPVLTDENADEAIRYQESRIAFHESLQADIRQSFDRIRRTRGR